MADAGGITVTVSYAGTDSIWQVELRLPAGATLKDAIEASGFLPQHPWFSLEGGGVGVFGKVRPLAHVLADHDRVEIYRALMFDPKESRRRRAAHKARREASRR